MITFKVSDLAGGEPCSPGFQQARALFAPDCEYSIAQIVEAGADPSRIEWLVLTKAKIDAPTLAGMRAWGREMGAELDDDADYGTTIKAVNRGWSTFYRAQRSAGMSEGRAANLAAQWRFEALQRAFA